MSTQKPDRSHEHELTLAATPAEVWRAITAAEELVRWFPLAAETRPGPGGEIVYRWGELVGRCRILEWKPHQHLRTSWIETPANGDAAPATSPLVVDWFIEARGGQTVLRLVHSGFGRDASFDKEYDGTRRGWEFELQSLAHYLERQRGRGRRAAWLRRPVTLDAQGVWQRFLGAQGVFRADTLGSLGRGDRFTLTTHDGETLSGRVLVNSPPLEFAATLESHDDGMLRFGFEDCLGRPEAHVWIATWGLGQTEFAALERRWQSALERVFPDEPFSATASGRRAQHSHP